MNPGIPLPFKRSQIQPVWRADRPQRGRFREFYQCDVDTIGTDSPIADAECIAVVHDALTSLGLTDFTIRVNHRVLLGAMAAAMGAADQEVSMLQAIDKLDKIGRDGVEKELIEQGFSAAQVAQLWGFLDGGAIPGATKLKLSSKPSSSWPTPWVWTPNASPSIEPSRADSTTTPDPSLRPS